MLMYVINCTPSITSCKIIQHCLHHTFTVKCFVICCSKKYDCTAAVMMIVKLLEWNYQAIQHKFFIKRKRVLMVGMEIWIHYANIILYNLRLQNFNQQIGQNGFVLTLKCNIKMNDGWILCSCFGFRVLVLWMLAHWLTGKLCFHGKS